MDLYNLKSLVCKIQLTVLILTFFYLSKTPKEHHQVNYFSIIFTLN
jgi:heme/copper-type cytochrome/quinol oxidase subunit 4